MATRCAWQTRRGSATACGSRAGNPAALLVLVDEAGFARRFGPTSQRTEQRRAAWRRLAPDVAPLFVDLEAPDVPAAQSSLRAALERP